MSRLNPWIVPPSDDGNTVRCKFCFEEIKDHFGNIDGICEDCYEAMEERYKAVLKENFDDDEIEWLNERNGLTGEVSIWLEEVAEHG